MVTPHGAATTNQFDAFPATTFAAGNRTRQEAYTVQASTLPLVPDKENPLNPQNGEVRPVKQETYTRKAVALLSATRGSTTHGMAYGLLQGKELPEYFLDDNLELAPEVARTQEMLGQLLLEVNSLEDLQRVLYVHFYSAGTDEIQLSEEMTRVFAAANEVLGLERFRDWTDSQFMQRVNTYRMQHSILPDKDGFLPDMYAVNREIAFNRDAQLRLMVVEALLLRHLCKNPDKVPELRDLMIDGNPSWYEKTVSTLPRNINDAHFESVISPYIHDLEMRRQQKPELKKYSLKDLLRGGVPEELYTRLQNELPDEIFQLINEASINNLHMIDFQIDELLPKHSISTEMREQIGSATMINALAKAINSFIHAKFVAAPLRTRIDILQSSADLNGSLRPGDTFYSEIFAAGRSFREFLQVNGVESIDLTSATELARMQELCAEYLTHNPEVKLECIELKTGDRSLKCNNEGRKEIRRWLAISLSMFHQTGLPHSHFIDWMQSAENPLLLLSCAGIGKFGSRVVGLLGSPRPDVNGIENVQTDTASVSPSQFLPSIHLLRYHEIIGELEEEFYKLIEEIDDYFTLVCLPAKLKRSPTA